MASSISLQDKIILITGAGDGIGKAVALAAAKQGAQLILLGKTPRKLENVYDAIIAAGGSEPAIYPLHLEGATADDYAALGETLNKEFSQLDGLILNAARAGQHAPIGQANIEQWIRTIHTNINANFALVQTLLPLLQCSDAASLVFTLHPEMTGRAYSNSYGVSKAALNSMADILAQELENSPVKVIKVAPPRVNTAFSRQIYPGIPPRDLGDVEAAVPLFLDALMTAQNGDILKA